MITKNRSLTRKEELIMLSILNLDKNAYLIAIVDHLSKITGKNASVTSVYFPLSRLEELEFLKSEFGDTTAVRGSRSQAAAA